MTLNNAETSQMLRSLFDAMDAGVAIYSSTDGQRFVFSALNRAGEQMGDVTYREIAGREVREVFPGVVEMGLYDVLRRVWSSGVAETLPVSLYDDRRISRYYENHVCRLSATQVAAVYIDVTTQKVAEDKLRKSEYRFRTLFETMQEGFALHEVVFDDAGKPADYRYLEINPAFERLTGLRRDTVVGRTVREVLPQIEEHWIETFCRVAISGEPAELENYVQELDRYYRARAYSPRRGRFVVVFEEVTEQKKALLELKKHEEQMRVLFESSLAGILMVNLDGAITLANNRMAEMFGCSMEELLRTRYPDHVHPDQRSTGDGLMRMLMAGEIDYVTTERHFIRRDGSDFWGLLSGRRHMDADGNFISLVGHITDISELKRTETEIRESESTFRKLFEGSSDAILLIDGTGVFVECNQAALDLLKMTREQFLLQPPDRISPKYQPDGRRSDAVALDMIAQAYSKGLHRFDWTCINAEEGEFIVEVSLMPIVIKGHTFLHTTWRDITERKRAEEERLKLEQQLLHAQKLESLGVLAGGIAHDFNNILMAIIGNADLALMRINRESPAVDNLQRIEKAAVQAADLAKQMLAYSGKGKFIIEYIDLNRLLEEMLHMLEVSISKRAVLRLNPQQPLPYVEADVTQIRQIVMNLVINASEAIGDKSGVIAITTGCMDCDKAYLKDVWLEENIIEGLYVFLEIADSGCGMDSNTLARIFDPFFTTKFTGRGLGMAAVLGIVRGHKGAIKVYSEPGNGTTFKILLPASDRAAVLFDSGPNPLDWRGEGKVLLIDDEETIRGVGAEMLKELGFETITASNGLEALEVFRQNPDIDLVILDLTMPHMDGEQCFNELEKLQPDVRVIMSSGYSEQDVTQKFVGKELAGFIQKPYTFSVLRDAVRKVLQV